MTLVGPIVMKTAVSMSSLSHPFALESCHVSGHRGAPNRRASEYFWAIMTGDEKVIGKGTMSGGEAPGDLSPFARQSSLSLIAGVLLTSDLSFYEIAHFQRLRRPESQH